MRNKKLQVFVSSTFEDLKEERQAAVEAILSAGHIPAGMELFTACDESQMTAIKRWIDDSDVYMLILGGRYGSVDQDSGKSYTQLEYEYAVGNSKPFFAVVISEYALDKKVKDFGVLMIEQENPKKLRIFRDEVKTKLVRFWDDKKDIKLAIHETLNDFSYNKELVGWVRGDNAINTGLVAEELARLAKENEELRKYNESASGGLYATLTFEQLKELLLEEIVSYGKTQRSLYDFLLQFGHDIRSAYKEVNDESVRAIFRRLKVYKIIENPNSTYMKLTEDGHNFYLKSLAKKS